MKVIYMNDNIYKCKLCQQKFKNETLLSFHTKHSSNEVINKKNKGIIHIIKKVLNKPDTYLPIHEDFYKTKSILEKNINIDNMSSNDINLFYKLGYSYSTMSVHLSKTFNIKLKSPKDGRINYLKKNNLLSSDDYYNYRKECRFSFSVYNEPNIISYELLKTYKFSTPQNKLPNELYIHRDHMYSVSDGFINNVDPKILSHPANCEIMLETNNIKKGSKSSITLEHLMFRINHWNDKSLKIQYSNKNNYKPNIKLSIKNKGKKIYNNGIKNFTVYVGDYIDPTWKKVLFQILRKNYIGIMMELKITEYMIYQK